MIPPLPTRSPVSFLAHSFSDGSTQCHTPRASILNIGPRSLLLLPTSYRCLLLPSPSPPADLPPTLTCPSLLASVPARLAFRTLFLLPFSLLFFSSSSSFFCHSSSSSSLSCCSSDPTSLTMALPVLQLHPSPHIPAAQEANKKSTPPKEARYSCSLLKRVFCPPLLLWIAPHGLSSYSLSHFLIIFFLRLSLFFSVSSLSLVLFHFVSLFLSFSYSVIRSLMYQLIVTLGLRN